MAITLQDPIEEQKGISIFPEALMDPPVKGRAARLRAEQYHFALAQDSPGVSELETSISLGQEDNLRRSHAHIEEVRQRSRNVENISNLAQRGDITPSQAQQAVAQYRIPQPVDPNTLIEDKYATRYLEQMLTNRIDAGSPVRHSLGANPQETREVYSGTQYLVVMNQIAGKVYEDAKAKYESQNVVARTLGNIGTMIPGVSAAATATAAGGGVGDIILPGSYLAELSAKFWQFDKPSEANAWLEKTVTELAKWNPSDALNLAKHIVSMSRSDRVATNIIGGSDAAIPLQTAAAGLKAVGVTAAAGTAFRNMMRHTVKGATAEDGLKLDRIYASLGDMDKAADARTAKKALVQNDPLGVTESLQERLPGWYNNSTGIFANPESSIPNDRAMKMEQVIIRDRADLTQGVVGGLSIPRVPLETIPTMRVEAKARINRHFNNMEDHILDSRAVYVPATRTWHEEHIVGMPDGKLFSSVDQATNYALSPNGLNIDLNAFKVGNVPTEGALYSHAEAIMRGIPDVNVRGSKIEGFGSIQGTVRLNNGAEIKVSNRKDGIYDIQTGFKLNVDNIAAYKGPRKDAIWTDVVHDIRPLTTAEIKQQGNHYYISIQKPMDETHQLARESLTIPTKNRNPNSAGGAFLDMTVNAVKTVGKAALAGINKIRTAEELVADFQRNNRHMATHLAPELQKIMAEKAVAIGGLSKGSRMDLDVILKINRDYEDKGMRGVAYKSQADLDYQWVKALGNVPTEAESYAYWSYHNLMNIDYVMRSLGTNRDLTRQGIETATITLGQAEMAKQVPFPGRIDELDNFLHSASNPGLMVVTADQPVRHWWKRDLTAKGQEADLNQIKSLVDEQGYKIVKVAMPTDRPFAEHTGIGNTVNFVLVKDVETQPLRFDIVPYRPGVHVIYLQEHFVKVPMIERSERGELRYYGDKTVSIAYTEAEAVRQAQALQTLQDMLKQQREGIHIDDATITAFIYRNLPEDLAFWREQFDTHIGYDHPIRNVHSGKQVLEQHPDVRDRYKVDGRDVLINERDSEHNLARAIDMDFLADRNTTMYAMHNKGTPEQPIWERTPAKTASPYVALERGVNNAIKNLVLNDQKISAIEQWASQYGKLVTDVDAAVNPYQAFYHGTLNPNVMNREEYHAAVNVRERTQQFIGLRTQFGDELTRLEIGIMNSMGENKAAYYRDHEKHFSIINDPVNFTRKFMFHNIFGLFNPKQFVIQAQGFSSVYGIMMGAHGPIEGLQMTNRAMAAYSATIGHYLTQNPNVIAHLDNIMVKSGWKKGEFIESYNAMRSVGWDVIGAEHALRDSSLDPKLWTNGVDRILEWGTYPFKEGERLPRVLGWHSAYLEWRKANPYKTITNYDIGDILRRADDLSLNMTRASHSAIQEGFFRLPAQFYTFTQRQMELYAGKRLSIQEKLGMFGMHSFLYGIPVAASAAILLPLNEMNRKNLLLQGNENVNKNWHNFTTQGFMSFVLQNLNPEERYGPGAQKRLFDIFTGNATFMETMLGATGSFIENMFKSLDPFASAVYTAATNKDQKFKITTTHLETLARQVSSVDSAMAAWRLYNTGQFISKNQQVLAEGLTYKDAIAVLFGLSPRKVSDARLVIGGTIEQNKNQEEMGKLALVELRRSYLALRDKDPKKWREHQNNAYAIMAIWGDMRDDQIAKTIQRSRKEEPTLYDQARQMYFNLGLQSQQLPRMRGPGF